MLPTAGLETQFPKAYVLAYAAGDLVGIAGLEAYGAHGLLRSVGVRHDMRGTGLGRALTRNRLDYARALGLESVYLLTTTAESYFPKFGFKKANRKAAPAELQGTIEFASACPSSAICLRLIFG